MSKMNPKQAQSV